MTEKRLHGKRIGYAITGSFCTLEETVPTLEELIFEGAEVTPILSEHAAGMDTRFGDAATWRRRFEALCGREALTTIQDVEPIGPSGLFDALVISPCTGNTMAKLANAITDTTVLMAAKAQLRNDRPVVLAISTNDGLGANAKNLGILLDRPNIFFVPFGQDAPMSKRRSLVCDMALLVDTVVAALRGEQLQPVLIERFRRERPVAQVSEVQRGKT